MPTNKTLPDWPLEDPVIDALDEWAADPRVARLPPNGMLRVALQALRVLRVRARVHEREDKSEQRLLKELEGINKRGKPLCHAWSDDPSPLPIAKPRTERTAAKRALRERIESELTRRPLSRKAAFKSALDVCAYAERIGLRARNKPRAQHEHVEALAAVFMNQAPISIKAAMSLTLRATGFAKHVANRVVRDRTKR